MPNFTPHGQAIRFGLAAVKNVGGNAIESTVGSSQEAWPQFPLGFLKFCGRSRPAASQQACPRVAD